MVGRDCINGTRCAKSDSNVKHNELLRNVCEIFSSVEFENMEEDVVPVTPSSDKGDTKTSPFSKSSIKAKFRGFKMGSFGRGKVKRPAVLQEVCVTNIIRGTLSSFASVVPECRGVYTRIST